MIGFLGSLLSRALPYVPRAINFIKSGLQYGVPALLKGIAYGKDIAQKLLPYVASIQAGVETAKQLPWIGEKVKQIAERPAVKEVLGGAESVLKSGIGYADILQKEIPSFVGKITPSIFA